MLLTAREHHASLVRAGIQQLLLSLEKLSPKLEGREDDIQFLKDMLQTEEFHSVMRVWKHCITHTVQDHIELASVLDTQGSFRCYSKPR